MAATGKETVTLKQAKVALEKLGAKQATETSYGTVKLISDEDLDAYINGSVEPGDIDLIDSDDISYTSFNFTATLSDSGVVTLDGQGGFSSKSFYTSNKYVLFTLPEGYRPGDSIAESDALKFSNRYSNTYYQDLHIDYVTGEVYIQCQNSMTNIINVTFVAPVTFELPASESNATGDEIITVEQLKNLISGSGGGSDENQEEELFSGYASEYDLFTNTADINKYSELVITVYPSGEERIDLTGGERFVNSTPYGYFVFDVGDGTLTWTTQTKYFTRVVGILK